MELLGSQAVARSSAHSPFSGKTFTKFKDIVASLEKFTRVEKQLDGAPGYRKLAVHLALRGFDAPGRLQCLRVEDCDLLADAWERAITRKALAFTAGLGEARQRAQADSSLQMSNWPLLTLPRCNLQGRGPLHLGRFLHWLCAE